MPRAAHTTTRQLVDTRNAYPRPPFPLGRPAQPAELAPAFVFLASPGASYVTGAVIPVTGGEIFA